MRGRELEDELERHHADSFGWALACCRWDRTEAEEVLQTTYLKVLDGRARFAGRSAFRTWLYAVIRRTAAERARRTRIRGVIWARWRAADPDPARATPPAAAPEVRLARSLAALAPRQRQVLHLVFYGELSVAEAADVMGVRLGTARVHYQRGKQRLRELLAQGDAP